MHVRTDRYVLVTGAGGFIGKPVVERLLHRGWNVKAMVRTPGAESFRPRVGLQVVYADVRDLDSLKAALKDVEVVVHLAAAKADEKWSAEVNVGGAERLVEACQTEGCARVINISSQAVKIPRKGVYALTKSQADRVFERSGLRVTSLLPSVVYKNPKTEEGTIGIYGTSPR